MSCLAFLLDKNELIGGHQGCIHQDENFEDVTSTSKNLTDEKLGIKIILHGSQSILSSNHEIDRMENESF
ncbi:hypothetical protein NC653_030582 [Populus alba x Populus x berolinensis]|uniref:Uncharacterized protein n=1 Tax=Populus alba x Populus x berolinensis TaxID=444605 RepID=A0AAD6LWD4_9ROSI|nr:hypothetical protein NC653_030582 [Populus alba x Populus x berolinensis]